MPVTGFQICTVCTSGSVSTRVASGLICGHGPLCQARWRIVAAPRGAPDWLLHKCTRLSELVVAIHSPSGLNATLYTAPVWRSENVGWPVARSHICAV